MVQLVIPVPEVRFEDTEVPEDLPKEQVYQEKMRVFKKRNSVSGVERAFVEFKKEKHAQRALLDLNGLTYEYKIVDIFYMSETDFSEKRYGINPSMSIEEDIHV